MSEPIDSCALHVSTVTQSLLSLPAVQSSGDTGAGSEKLQSRVWPYQRSKPAKEKKATNLLSGGIKRRATLITGADHLIRKHAAPAVAGVMQM